MPDIHYVLFIRKLNEEIGNLLTGSASKKRLAIFFHTKTVLKETKDPGIMQHTLSIFSYTVDIETLRHLL